MTRERALACAIKIRDPRGDFAYQHIGADQKEFWCWDVAPDNRPVWCGLCKSLDWATSQILEASVEADICNDCGGGRLLALVHIDNGKEECRPCREDS